MTAALSVTVVLLIGVRLRPRPRRVAELHRVASAPARPPAFRALTVRGRPRPLRRRRVDPSELAAWCSDLAAACRSGDTLAAAVRGCRPPVGAAEPIGALVLAIDRGVPLADAVSRLDAGPAADGLDLALTVVRACARTGGPPAEPLDRAAAALRARAAESADRRTHSAQARLSAVVMTILPTAMLLLLVATSGSVRSALGTPIGSLSVAVGIGLNLLGWRWMRRLIDRSVG